jgi:hypothetical protein
MQYATFKYLVSTLLLSAYFGWSGESQQWPAMEFEWQAKVFSKSTLTLEDYFLLLPSEFLDCENGKTIFDSKEKRTKQIQIKDLKNGYFGFFKGAQIALFKNKKSKTDFIAVQIGKSGAGSQCGAINGIFELDKSQRKWKSRNDLLPTDYTFDSLYERLSSKEVFPYFDLPRKGTTLFIKEESKDSLLYKLKWTGEAFQLIP